MVQKKSVLRATFHTLISRWKINELYHQLMQNTYEGVIWLTLLFTIGSAVLPSNKLYFVLATLYVLSVFYLTRSIYKTFFLVLIPLEVLNIGQLYVTTVIPYTALKDVAGYDGRQLYFRFSPYFVALITSIALLVIEVIRQRGKLHFQLTHLFLFGALLFSTGSVFTTEQFPMAALGSVVMTLGLVSWTILSQLFLAKENTQGEKRIFKTFLFIVILMSTIQVSIATGQYFKHSTLNLRIEQSTIIPYFGQGADENSASFRPIGLQTHANELANSCLIYLFVGLVLFQWLKQLKEKFPWWFELFFAMELITTIVITQSRAAYLGLLVASLFFFFTQKETSLILLHFLKERLRPFILLFVIAAIFFVPLVSQRLLYSLNSFGAGGGFTTRQALEKQAFSLLKESPFFGVGPGMFIAAAYRDNPHGIIHYFPEAVHNGFILYLTENGIFSSLFLLTFFYLLIKQINTLGTTVRSLILSGVLAISIMTSLHPFENFFTSFVLISWLIVYIQQGKPYAKNSKH